MIIGTATGTIKLIGSPRQIEQNIIRASLDQLARQLTAKVMRRKGSLLRELREEVKRRIIGSPEWLSMSSGQLRGQLGLDNPEQRLSTILSIWLDSVQLSFGGFRAVGNRLQGSLRLWAIQANYEDVINTPEALIELEKGMFPWLAIMLLAGDQILVRNYTVLTSSKVSAYSRSGMNSIMVKSKSKSWQVPPNYSGTINNNWITRAIAPLDQYIEQEFRKLLA